MGFAIACEARLFRVMSVFFFFAVSEGWLSVTDPWLLKTSRVGHYYEYSWKLYHSLREEAPSRWRVAHKFSRGPHGSRWPAGMVGEKERARERARGREREEGVTEGPSLPCSLSQKTPRLASGI